MGGEDWQGLARRRGNVLVRKGDLASSDEPAWGVFGVLYFMRALTQRKSQGHRRQKVMKSDAINELATALSLVHGELQDVRKSNAVTDYYGKEKYKYADLGQVLAEVRPALAKHGLAVVQMPGRLVDGEISLETILMHSSGQWISTISSAPIEQVFSKDGKAVTTQAQAVGTVISYLRRYCLAAMVGLTQVDNDASSHQTPVDGHKTPVIKTTATKVATEPKAEQSGSQGLSRVTQEMIWNDATKVWPKSEAPAKIKSLLESLGLPLRSADLTEEQGQALLKAIELEGAKL